MMENSVDSKSFWQVVSEEIARDHELYGFGGWLWLFTILLVLSNLAVVYTVVNGWQDFDRYSSMVAMAPVLWHSVLLVDAGLTGLLLIAWLCRVTHFRIFWLIVTVGTGLSIPAILIVIGTMVAKVDPAEGERILQVVGEVLFTSVAQSMPYMCGFLAYMLRSRRFRVTFESKLRDDDRRLLAQANGPGFPPPPRGTSAFVQGPR